MAINRDKVLEAAQKFVEKKKYDKAVAELQKLVEADKNDARTLLKIGDLWSKQNLHDRAIETYESVGKLYAQQGFALKAIAVYKQIREIIGKHVPHLEERYGHITPKLAELYQQLGLTSDALAALDEVATRLQRQQKDAEAIDVFRKIVELDPTNPLPHLRLAEALSRVKDVDGAVGEFKTAAGQLAGIGRRDDAIKVLERLLHHKPDPEQSRVCAELYLTRGQAQDGMQALAKLQLCFQANPRDFDTLALLARAFNSIGQGAKAIEVQKEMARVARDSGKPDLFREIVERLLRVAPQDDGVRKLAAQSGSMAAGGPAYASASMPPSGAASVPPAPSSASQMQSGSYLPARQGQQPPGYGQPQPSGYGQQQPQPSGYGQQQQQPSGYRQQQQADVRPATSPLQRPATANAAFQAPLERAAPAGPPVHEISEAEVDELSYEEVDADDVEAYSQRQGGDAAAYAEGEDAGYERGDAAQEPAATYGEDASYEQQPEYEGEAPALEEVGEEADLTEQLQKVLQDAASFRRVRLYHKAIETLRYGLELDPRSMDLHEVYRDVLIEAGQTDDAVQEMLVIASLYVDALDGDSAARALQDVLAFDPQNARAVEMLQELGYEIVDENEENAAGEAPAEAAPEEPAYAEEAQERLPSYDLEEMGAADVGAHYAQERQVYVRQSQHPQGTYPDHALPSFPLDEPEAAPEYAQPVEERVAPAAAQRPMAPRPDAARPRAPSVAPARAQSVAPAQVLSARPPSMELEDALDEAEFFCSRGLFDDARAILAEQLASHPKHPLLRERLEEIDAQAEQRGSGAREKPKEQDRAFDIAASLDALESLDYGNPQPAEGFANEDQQIDVEEVFAKFKEGVEKQISVDDSDSHYNLGIAYKEMMLVDDAIREFEVAARDPKRECVCRSMIGMIHIERGNINEAIDAFLQGLNAAIKDPQQETVLCYEIGTAYEAKKMLKDALSYFQKAMRRDPNYRDVQERVRRLAKSETKQSVKAAVGADDEFDRAFDDLLGKA